MMNEYERQAKDFLKKTGAKITISYKDYAPYFEGEKEYRNIYRIRIDRNGKSWSFNFGDSIASTNNGDRPTAYDVLACITKYEPLEADVWDFAKEYGYVETMLGRRRYLRDINSGNSVVRSFAERNAINAPIQGSSADMIKIAMTNIYNEMKLKDLKSKMILQVHDELVFDVCKDELEVLSELIKDKMINALQLDVPIIVNINTGNNWLEAH